MNDQMTTLLMVATLYAAYLLAIGSIILEAAAVVLGLGLALHDLVAWIRASVRRPAGAGRWAHR